MLNAISLFVNGVIAAYKTRLNHDIAPILRLPDELLCNIVEYVDERDDQLTMRGTCYFWQQSLNSYPFLWDEMAWPCLARRDAVLPADLDMLDFWMSLTAKAVLELKLPTLTQDDARLIKHADYLYSLCPLQPYMETLATHASRMRKLHLCFNRTNYFDALAFLPTLPALELLLLLYAVEDWTVDEPPRMSDLLRNANSASELPSLKTLCIENLVLDSPLPRIPLFEHLECIRIDHGQGSFNVGWIDLWFEGCNALKDIQILLLGGTVVEAANPASFVRRMERALLFCGTGSARVILGHLRHRDQPVLELQWAVGHERPYFIFADVRDCVSVSLTRSRVPGTALDAYLDLECVDGRGFSRRVTFIRPSAEAGDLGEWTYHSVWQHVETTQLRTIRVAYGHWHALSDGVQLPALRTLVVLVSPDDAPCADDATVNLPRLQTVRFETQFESYWRPLGAGVVPAFLEGLACASAAVPRVELDRRTRVPATDLATSRNLASELVME